MREKEITFKTLMDIFHSKKIVIILKRVKMMMESLRGKYVIVLIIKIIQQYTFKRLYILLIKSLL